MASPPTVYPSRPAANYPAAAYLHIQGGEEMVSHQFGMPYRICGNLLEADYCGGADGVPVLRVPNSREKPNYTTVVLPAIIHTPPEIAIN